MLSIIIPTFNEAQSIGRTLDALTRLSGPIEIIVVDGGSEDETASMVQERGLRLLTSEKGRGAQMHKGACAASGEALWFLHADTIPAADAARVIREALREREVVGGNFGVCFDGARPAARFLTWLYPRLRRLGLCYGDSAIFVRRETYERIGGFQPFPIFEDLDLIRRLWREGKLAHLQAQVITSSRRFEGRSFTLTFARWSILQALYWLGIHPRHLARIYAPVRKKEVRG
jgi:rSAM/selenodomain-associated transferase 2